MESRDAILLLAAAARLPGFEIPCHMTFPQRGVACAGLAATKANAMGVGNDLCYSSVEEFEAKRESQRGAGEPESAE